VTYHSDIVRRELAMKGYAPLLRRFLTDADRIVTTSPNLLANSQYLSPFAQKCRVIPPVIDADRYRTYDGSDLELVDPTRPTVLFVGRLSYYKGLPDLLEASRRLDAEVIIAGDGKQRARLEAKASTLDVTDRVRFLGYVSDRKLEYLYHNADVFVLPSTEPSEAFGIVQLEAMASGLPVVNTDLETGVPWVSQHGETGLTVPPGDADSLADAIEALLSDPERRARFGTNARNRIETTFDIDRSLDAHERLYAELLE
jgi:rhamnosyl/mannosyltransferase